MKTITMDGTFNEWWNCNKDGDILKDDYNQYLFDCEECQTGEKVLSYKNWAKARYKSLEENEGI